MWHWHCALERTAAGFGMAMIRFDIGGGEAGQVGFVTL
jgi:hypothetical protein